SWSQSGSAQIDTEYSKFGGSSGLFPSTSSDIRTADTPDLRFDDEDFCIEGWFRPAASGAKSVFNKGHNTANGLQLFVSTSEVRFRTNVFSDLTWSGSISSTEFTHIAITRSGANRAIFVGGTLVASGTGVPTLDSTAVAHLGAASP